MSCSPCLCSLLAFLLALGAQGCGGNSSGGGAQSSVAAAVTSATPAATTSGSASPATTSSASPAPQPAPPTPPTLSFADPGYVPSTPSSAAWHAELDDPATAENEAARQLAQAIAGNGLRESQVYEHLVLGGVLAIWVSGAGHERDTPTRRSGWMAPYARYVQGTLGLPGIQVDYQDWAAGTDARALATYAFSLRTGVSRTLDLIEKARSAGASGVRLFGHSKGGDVVQDVVWRLGRDPFLLNGVAVGVPLWSAAHQDSVAPYGYGGLWRLGRLRNRDYVGKLVLFVRFSDRASRGELLPADTFPGPGHDYRNVFATPGFAERLDEVLTLEPVGFEDRAFGLAHDY